MAETSKRQKLDRLAVARAAAARKKNKPLTPKTKAKKRVFATRREIAAKLKRDGKRVKKAAAWAWGVSKKITRRPRKAARKAEGMMSRLFSGLKL